MTEVPWHRRLSVRVAILLAVTLIAFDWLSPSLFDFVLTRLGFSSSPVFYTKDDVEWEERAAEGIRDALSSPVAPEILSKVLTPQEEGYVLLSDDGMIESLSSNLPLRVGARWPFPRESHTRIVLPESSGTAHVVYSGDVAYVIFEDEDDAAEPFCSVEALGDPLYASAVYEDIPAFEAALDRESRAARLVSMLISVAVACVVAIALSRWVTRRVRRLARAAAKPVAQGGGLPGPFDASGNDEIARLASTMNSMRDGLARTEAERREWIAQVSHDLRTPLTALLACLDRTEGAVAGDEELGRLVQTARMDAERVQTLADDLLEIARLDDRDALVLDSGPPGELVRQTARLLSPLAEKHGHVMTVEVESGLPELAADGRRLMRALENVTRNAIQHARGRIVLTAAGEQDFVRFEVRDDGPGLPIEDAAVDFRELARRRSRSDSAGLGLQVTARVAEAHQGSAGAGNLSGGGARVWIRIPVRQG